MSRENIRRSSASVFCLIAVLTATISFGQQKEYLGRPKARAPVRHEPIKPTSNPGIRDLLITRPDFQPDAIGRGEADEKEIAGMGADGSHGVSLMARVYRTEHRHTHHHRREQHGETSGDNEFWFPPANPGDRYLMARVRVFDAEGRLVPMTEFYKNEVQDPRAAIQEGPAATGWHIVSPAFLDLIPNLVYDMTRPGEYWILVEMQANSTRIRGIQGAFYARAKPIKVKVLPEVDRLLPGNINAVIDPDRL